MEQAHLEASLKIEKTRLETSLDALKLEKKVAAAIAKAEALEAAMEDESEDLSSNTGLQIQDPAERTKEYVEEQAKHATHQSTPVLEGASTDSVSQPETVAQHTPKVTAQAHNQDNKPSHDHHHQERASLVASQVGHTNAHMSHTPDRKAQQAVSPKGVLDHMHHTEVFNDRNHPHPQAQNHQYAEAKQANSADSQSMSDFVRFFARRELVSSGLLQFSDHPESYRAWEVSFLNAIRGLDVTESEEMDLLVKWLGAESAEHVRRIRAVHVHCPERGLKMVWNRLDEAYGSPEVIENSLFQRVDNFPKISNKDHRKLQELGDLLMKLEAAKSDGDLPGLAYLDTAHGISPIVQKLPYNLQEKWILHGSRFKEEYNVPFPPFDYFVDFVCQQAKMRNDPSFSFVPGGTDPPLMRKSAPKYSSQRSPILVHKTEVSPHTSSSADTSRKSKVDPAKQCPVHNKPHPLQKCRGFREKSIEHRKTLLKQHGICFKCCASSAHLAKKCDNNTKSAECGSESHVSTLHPRPAPWSLGAQTQLQVSMAGRKEAVLKKLLFPQAVLRFVEETLL